MATRRSARPFDRSCTPLRWRALQYLLGCWACQTSWTAVLIYDVTAGVTAPAAWFLSAAAYSGAAVLLTLLHGAPLPVRFAERPTGSTDCKSCGR
jgi:hypothetical protein